MREQAPAQRAARVRAVCALADGLAGSPQETRLRLLMARRGVPEPVAQFVVRDRSGFVARVDFVVAGTRVIVEFDGRVKYGDESGATLFDEKKREDRLRALGYIVVRIVWADLETPGRVAAKVLRAMAIAA